MARRSSAQRSAYLGSMQNRIVSPERDAYACARLDPFYGAAIVEDDPYAPDARFEDAWNDAPPATCPLRSSHRTPRPCNRDNGHDGRCDFSPRSSRVVVPAGYTPEAFAYELATKRAPELAPEACPRCTRTDWQTPKGRQWHIDNYPDCANGPRKAEHTYATPR